MAANFAAYAERNRVLVTMGFKSYSDYLKSDLWAGIRQRVLDSNDGTCACCRVKPANQVHHRKYTPENLSGRSLSHLIALCAGCHRNAEFSGKYGKVGLHKANSRLKTIAKNKAKDYCWKNMPEYRQLWHQLKEAKKPGTPFRQAKMAEIRKKMRKLMAIAKNRSAGSENPGPQPQHGNQTRLLDKPEGHITR